MKANRFPRAARRALAVAALAVGVVACESDPSPQRVARDIIESEFELGRLTEAEAECMLGKLDNFSNDELKDIADGLDRGEGSSERADAEQALRAYELELAACKN